MTTFSFPHCVVLKFVNNELFLFIQLNLDGHVAGLCLFMVEAS